MPNKFFLNSAIAFTSAALTLGICAASHVGMSAIGLHACIGNLNTKLSAIASLQRCQRETGANLNDSFSHFKPGEELTDKQLEQIRVDLDNAGREFFLAKRKLIWPWPIDITGVLWLIASSGGCAAIAVWLINKAFQEEKPNRSKSVPCPVSERVLVRSQEGDKR